MKREALPAGRASQPECAISGGQKYRSTFLQLPGFRLLDEVLWSLLCTGWLQIWIKALSVAEGRGQEKVCKEMPAGILCEWPYWSRVQNQEGTHLAYDHVLPSAWDRIWSAQLTTRDGIKKRKQNILVLLLIYTYKHKSCLRSCRGYSWRTPISTETDRSDSNVGPIFGKTSAHLSPSPHNWWAYKGCWQRIWITSIAISDGLFLY